MISAGSVVTGAAGRLLVGPRGRDNEYALCPEDRFWFRPRYTAGRCPLCGEVVPGGAPPLSLLMRIDRFRLGMAFLVLASLGMSILVLFMYFET